MDDYKKVPDFLIRAAKTFIQALIPVFAANWAAIQAHIVAWDFNDWKGWLLPIIISAVSAGLAAVWNLIIEVVNRKANLHILENMTKEEIEEFLELALDELDDDEDEEEDEESEGEGI